MTSTERRFAYLFYFFNIGGFPITTKKLPLLQNAYNLAVDVSCYSVYFACVFNGYMNTEDLKSGMTTLCHIVSMTTILCTEVNYRIQMKTLQRLFNLVETFTWEDMPLIDEETGKLTMAGWIPRIEKFIKRFVLISFTVHIIQSLVRIITTDNMVYDTLYPFKISESPIYEIILITQFLTSARLVTIFYGCPCVYTILICVACSQLQKVRLSLLEIKWKYSESLEKSMDDQNVNEDEARQIQNKLNGIVQLHQKVISYVGTLEDMTTMLMGEVFLFFLLAQCTAAFAAVLNLDNINDLSRVMLIYLTATGMEFVYCWFGNMLSDEYDAVRNAAWGCEWVGTPLSFQKCISFIICISKQGFTLTAAKFLPVSNSTLMSMINESMSLFMFLLTMKDKNN